MCALAWCMITWFAVEEAMGLSVLQVASCATANVTLFVARHHARPLRCVVATPPPVSPMRHHHTTTPGSGQRHDDRGASSSQASSTGPGTGARGGGGGTCQATARQQAMLQVQSLGRVCLGSPSWAHTKGFVWLASQVMLGPHQSCVDLHLTPALKRHLRAPRPAL